MIIRSPDGWLLALDAVAPAELFPEEAALLGPNATPKRRLELSAGRHVARLALRAWGCEPGPVLRDDKGRPTFPGVCLSISHADGCAIAVVAQTPIGCDVASDEPFSDAFLEDVFVPGELDAWRRLGLPVAAAFAAKEALLKWLGEGLRLAMHSVSVLPTSAEPVDFAGLAGVRLVCQPDLPRFYAFRHGRQHIVIAH